MEDYRQLTLDYLRKIAPGMAAISEAKSGVYTFDAVTASIIWNDELPSLHLRGQAHTWGLRPVFGYRGSIISGTPDRKLEEYWLIAKQLFPTWIGFHPERCKADPVLAQFISDSIASMSEGAV